MTAENGRGRICLEDSGIRSFSDAAAHFPMRPGGSAFLSGRPAPDLAPKTPHGRRRRIAQKTGIHNCTIADTMNIGNRIIGIHSHPHSGWYFLGRSPERYRQRTTVPLNGPAGHATVAVLGKQTTVRLQNLHKKKCFSRPDVTNPHRRHIDNHFRFRYNKNENNARRGR